MKLFATLRTLLTTSLIVASTAATATPTLLVQDGKLTGANNVNVGGTLYNVTFQDGTCISVFKGCVQSEFVFTTPATASAAAQALLDQVFVDGPAGNFDTESNTTVGCTDLSNCWTRVPQTSTAYQLYYVSAINQFTPTGTRQGLSTPRSIAMLNDDTATSIYSNWAVFKLATPESTVPEPGTIALLGLALAGMTVLRRRKS